MGKRNSAAAAAKLTAAEAKVALAARRACTATAYATHAARVAKATAAAATLAARVYVPTKARPYVAPVDVSAARNVVRLARAASLCAVKAMRAIRMADAIAAVKARATKAPAISVPTTVVEVHTVNEEAFASWHRAFLAQVHAYIPVVTKALKGPTVGLSLEQKVAYKAMRLGARRGATKSPKAKARLNSAEKRQQITLTCKAKAAARAAKAKEEAIQMASGGNTLSAMTIAARAAQASAQKAVNAVRKLQALLAPKKAKGGNKTTTTGILVVEANRPSLKEEWELKAAFQGPVKGSNTKIADVRNELKTRAHIKEAKQKDLAIAKAKKAAMRQKWIELRKEKIARICTKAWMHSGIWVDSFLVEACSDSDYETREKAYTELLALVGAAA